MFTAFRILEGQTMIIVIPPSSNMFPRWRRTCHVSLRDEPLEKWWGEVEKNSCKGGWLKKILQRRSGEKKSCKFNCTVRLTNCLHPRATWQSLYTTVLISSSWWNPHSPSFLWMSRFSKHVVCLFNCKWIKQDGFL